MSASDPGPIHLTYLGGPDIDRLALTDDEILDPVEGALIGQGRPHVETGRLSERNLHGELGEIAAGKTPGRERDEETILFWHRGLSTTDIALGHALLAKARTLGVGQRLRYA